jgi:Trk K+ transport system NAD-binding subunit
MRELEKSLRDLGLEVDVVTGAGSGAFVGRTVEELEERGKGAFFIIQINRANGEAVTRPPGDLRLAAGDSLVVVARDGAPVHALFNNHRKRA